MDTPSKAKRSAFLSHFTLSEFGSSPRSLALFVLLKLNRGPDTDTRFAFLHPNDFLPLSALADANVADKT